MSVFSKLLVLTSIVAAQTASAFLYVEPYVGYAKAKTTGTLSLNYDALYETVVGFRDETLSSTWEAKGVAYGLRASFNPMWFHIGVDWSTGTYDKEAIKMSTNGTLATSYLGHPLSPYVEKKASGSFQALGPMLGISIPMTSLRLFGTYFVSGDSKMKTDTDTQTFSGKGYKLTVGYTFLHFGPAGTSLNFEYTKSTLTEYKDTAGKHKLPETIIDTDADTGATITSTESSYDSTVMMISLGFPISI